jgi:hypothetical protein
MKITKEQYEYLKEKEFYQTEGIVRAIFAKLLTKKLKSDPKFMSAVDKVDKASEDLRNSIISAEKNGVVVPDELKKYAGL